MSTKISAIYDDLHALMAELFPDHAELINPYVPQAQDNLSLAKAWGVTIVSGANTTKETCALGFTRGFEVVLTRKIHAGLMRTEGAKEKRREMEKELLEDSALLANKLQDDTYLKDSEFFNASKVSYETDGGLEFVRADQFDLIFIRANLPIEYTEHLGG